MKRLLLTMMVALLWMTAAMAQSRNLTVQGKVVENETGEPVLQATVQLLSLPDSTYVTGIASKVDGTFELPRVAAGNYVLRISYIGYKNIDKALTLNARSAQTNVGVLKLVPDAVALKETVITAEAAQVQLVEDTLVYNASAYRTPEGAMLEELVRKLPGAEVDEEGNIKVNGKQVKKIMVNGEEFFGGDVQTGMKNLPVNMVEKLKTYDKKSDMARVTGIDDGEEETVLDLTVKKGMNQGYFGNVDLGAGSKDRYTGRAMINYFSNKSQVSLIASANNVNDQGFSGGGFGGARFGRNNGLTATKTLGMSFATKTDKMEVGGSVRYNYRDNDMQSTGSQENFLNGQNSSFMNSISMSRAKNRNLNADLRLEWKPDSLTNIILRPNLSVGKGEQASDQRSSTFSADPYDETFGGLDPNLYLDNTLDQASDPFYDIRKNMIQSGSASDSKQLSTNTSLQVNRKLNDRGRNVTFRGEFRYGDNKNDQYTQSLTHYYELQSIFGGDSTLIRNQYINSPTNNRSYSVQVTYSEPIARATFLQLGYQFQYGLNDNDKSTYDLRNFDWMLGQPLPTGYETARVDSLGKYAEYRYYNHDASVALRFIREKFQLSAGMSFQPQHTVLSYKKADYMIDTTRNVFNFAPNIDLRLRFSKVSQLRLMYRGRTSQPSMENLLPIVDNSNPQNIRVGNPGLKPSFTHQLTFFYNSYNAEKQQGITANAFFNATQNSISNSRVYNQKTGGWTTTPKNINGNWNAQGVFGYNTALKDKRFTINTFTTLNYANNVAYLTNMKTRIEQKNTTTNLLLGERLNAAYRNNWFEFGVNGSINYNIEKDKLNSNNNQHPYTYSYGASTTINMPWGTNLSTNITDNARRGYSDRNMNRNELIWNAQVSHSFFKGAGTLSFEMYDILRKQSNITRSYTANGRSVYSYNGINSYCMVHFIYRLNIFGNKEARQGMNNRMGGRAQFGPGAGGAMGPRPGGFGGGRP